MDSVENAKGYSFVELIQILPSFVQSYQLFNRAAEDDRLKVSSRSAADLASSIKADIERFMSLVAYAAVEN